MQAIGKLCAAAAILLGLTACASQQQFDTGAYIRSMTAAPLVSLAAPKIFVATTRCDDNPDARPPGEAGYLRTRCWDPIERVAEVKQLGFGMADGGKTSCAMATVPILAADADSDQVAGPATLVREDCGANFEPLRQKILATSCKCALVYIHGYNTNFAYALKRTAQLARDLNPDGLTILFSPAAAGYSIDYASDIEASEIAAPVLNRLLAALSSSSASPQLAVDVIAHSMGARLTLRAMTEGPSPKVKNLILPAADVEPAYFVRKAKLAAPKYERMIVYTARQDRALELSRIAHNGWARAGVGLSAGLGQDLTKAEFVDASKVAKDLYGFSHSYFAESLSVLNDIRTVLRDYRSPDLRAPLKCDPVSAASSKNCRFP